MTQLKKRNRLLARMVLMLLPASALPLFVFGYIAIKSHYDSLRTQSLAAHKTLATFMGSQLESDVARSLQQLKSAAENDVFRTTNDFMSREALANLRALSGGAFVQVMLLDADLTVRDVEPLSPGVEGKRLADVDLGDFNQDGLAVSNFVTDDAAMPRFYAARRFKAVGGRTAYLCVEVTLAPWAQISRAIIKNQTNLLAALIPTRKRGDPIRLNEEADLQFWSKIAALRSGGSEATEQEIGGETHHVMFQEIEGVPVRLVVAQPIATIYASPRQVMMTYVGIIAVLFVALSVLLFLLARSITGPIRQIAEAATAFADGRLDVRAPVVGAGEISVLAETFNKMGESLQVSHLRMRVLYKSIMELFACNDADALMRKAVELACTQCQGEVSWFLPHNAGREIAYAEDSIFLGLHGWVWKNHRSVEVDLKESAGVWRRVEGDRVFTFTMKNQGEEVGILRVAYRKAPDETMVSLLHSLISLVEMAVAKQELVHQGALVTTELEMAEAVQRNIMSEAVVTSASSRIAYHYQPASRLGGDWFFLIDEPGTGSLYVIMGDVTGHGLAQGLVTTAVKGALDVVEHQMRHGNGTVRGPADIVQLLATVVGRVAGRSELSMTCLAAKIDFQAGELRLCNAGHTFPILVRQEGGETSAVHLHKNQQPLLGYRNDTGSVVTYFETVYPLKAKDLLVVYTDGLTEAKNLKSQIFGRFLFRSLKRQRDYAVAEELKNEILGMFRYYTQDKRIEDDVCFLVVQMQAEDGVRQESA